MNHHVKWQIRFGAGLVMLSAALYSVHYLIFHDAHHIFSYILTDIAFVPIEVLLVTLIIHRLLEMREKQAMLQKMNMAIGVFFGELGTELLGRFKEFDIEKAALRDDFLLSANWNAGEFDALIKKYRAHEPKLGLEGASLAGLKDFLVGRRLFLLGLLENPNLLEHDSFTDLLWALFHLTEELSHRAELPRERNADCEHLLGDVRRAYSMLIVVWLEYMSHLKKDYPYLFSLAMRTNPFDAAAKVEIV